MELSLTGRTFVLIASLTPMQFYPHFFPTFGSPGVPSQSYQEKEKEVEQHLPEHHLHHAELDGVGHEEPIRVDCGVTWSGFRN
jgi:hypothetical protein